MTRRRSAGRSSAPSAARTSPPNRRAISRSTGLPGAWTSRVNRSASMIVAPQPRNSPATADFPAAMFPVRPTLSIERRASEEQGLVLVPPRHLVAVAAAGLVALAPAHHDGGGVVA